MRALKALVIFMGVVIVLGVTVIFVTIFNRLQNGTLSQNASPDSGFATQVGVPAGSLAGITADGGRIVLRYELSGGGVRLVVIDSSSGRRLGVVDLVEEP